VKNKPLFVFLIILLFSTVVISVRAFDTPDELTVSFLNIGQGDAIFIESPTGVQVLIDGGPGKAVLRELGAVMPLGDRSLDIIIATHPDMDHIGGLPFVLETYEVDTVIRSGFVADTQIYEAFTQGIEEEGSEVIFARKGHVIHLGDGVHLDILFPDAGESMSEANEASIVARLVYGEAEVLLMGDAPQWVERELMHDYGSNIASDILKVGHHGSRSSTASAFVSMVSPVIAVLSYGEDNRYNHPHKEVLDVLEGIRTLHTPQGRVECRTKGVEWVCD